MSDRKYTMAEIDIEGVERLLAKLPSTIPGKLKKIPTVEQKDELLSKIKGNAVWLILTYGAGLVSLVSPIAGKALKALFKWRFHWESKDLPFKL